MPIEFDLARRLTRCGRLAARGSFAVNVVDGAFQTNARTFGFLGRTRLASRGLTYAGSLGLSYALGGRTALGIDVLYAPLRIRRPSDSSPSIDGLLTARGLLTYRLH